VPERLDPRRLVAEARDEARELGSSRVEAEHLLLALASHPETAAGRLLAEERLDPKTLRKALALDFERTLAMVGIRLESFALPEVRTSVARGPGSLGHSAKLAFERALKLRASQGRGRRPDSLDLLEGILNAEAGTVGRALAAIEVSRNEVVLKVREARERAA
jgi:ATP-dependent Clp protease ATP-binding subunit ClpA